MSFLDVFLFLLGVYLIVRLCTRPSVPYPPGPPGLPWIGSALHMPTHAPWKTFAQWGNKCDITSFTVFGQRFVIINSPQIAIDLLSKKRTLYADRPTMEMAALCGWHRVLSSARYGPRFREYRKLIGRVIGTRGHMVRFYPVEDYQATMFLRRVLNDPERFEDAARKSAGATILHLTYGYKAGRIREEGSDPFVDLADKAMSEFSEVTRPGAYLVDFLPFFKHVPSWFPGAGFKRTAATYLKSCNDMSEIPLDFVKQQLTSGKPNFSYAAALLKEPHLDDERMHDIKWSAASFYGAGADTTVSVVYSYFLAVCKYPEIQARAQAEVDSVVGMDRLPSFGDRENLVYVEAVCKELYRWLPIVPLAVPHRAMADDFYNGYVIPKHSLVIANVWKFLHDPVVYHDPLTFNPDRFLGPSPAPDPRETGVFGYGRRICPGNHLADVSVWINVAKAIAALHVSKAVDENGKIIEPVADTTDGVIVRPLPFRCSVKPRSEHILKLIDEALLLAESD
ncbi:cytochrome P450 [Fistulina hepatica ATCC 64428]|nr:cytochrome P450 [Fistulina hepatica ATCC 64428]